MQRMIRHAIIVSGFALALAGCGGGDQPANDAAAAANNQPAAAQAAVQPVANNGTPQAPVNGGPGNGGPQGMRPGVMGQVTAINGSTLTVQDARQGTTTSVTLSDSTQVYKQGTIELAAIPTGETIMARGTQDGDAFTADQIRVGAGGGPGAGGPPTGGDPGQDQQPPQGNSVQPPQGAPGNGAAGGPGAGGPGGMLFGTVTAVASDALTVQAQDGTTVQVKLATNGAVTQQVQGAASDITTGVQIMAVGDTTDSGITATMIQVMPAVAQQ